MSKIHPREYLEVIFADAGVDVAKAQKFTHAEASRIVQKWINDLHRRSQLRLGRSAGTIEDYLLVSRGDLVPLRIAASKQIVANLK